MPRTRPASVDVRSSQSSSDSTSWWSDASRCHAVASSDRAEDVVHEAFVVAWRRMRDLPPSRDAQRAWLFGVAHGCLLNDRRASTRRGALGVRLAAQPEPLLPSPDERTAARSELATAWHRLAPDHQEVLSLLLWDDLTSADAGRVLGISAVAYRLRLHRARAALRRLLSPDEGPDADGPGCRPAVPLARSLDVPAQEVLR